MRKPRYPGVLRRRIVYYVHPELQEEIQDAAQRDGLSASDWNAGLAAKAVGWTGPRKKKEKS